jgi:hypothetical protein
MAELNGTCGCGCGSTTNLDSYGKPRRYVKGHGRRGKGKGWIEQGHWFIQHKGRRRALHRVIVEAREGRRLRSDEVVHHLDWNPVNNDPKNLVILSRAEHMRLHVKGQRRRCWSDEEIARAIALYVEGMNLDEVASALGRPYSSTQRQIARAGRGRTPEQTRALRRPPQPAQRAA